MGSADRSLTMPLDISRIRALCFDVDGTLSDTDDLYVRKVARYLHPFRFLLPGRDAARLARRLVMYAETPGNALYAFADRLNLDDLLYKIYSRRSQKAPGEAEFLLVPGVRPMLEAAAARYPLAVVSARGEYTTLQFLEQYDLSGYFRAIATAHTCRRTKPSPDPLLWAAAQLGIPPENCVMVGDTTVDIRTGKAAGAQTIGVLCGFGERAELERAGADAIVESTAEVASLLG